MIDKACRKENKKYKKKTTKNKIKTIYKYIFKCNYLILTTTATTLVCALPLSRPLPVSKSLALSPRLQLLLLHRIITWKSSIIVANSGTGTGTGTAEDPEKPPDISPAPPSMKEGWKNNQISYRKREKEQKKRNK